MAALIGNMNRELIVIMGRSSILRAHNTVVINSKRFVRALRRKPVAVLYPDGQRETLTKSNLTAVKTKPYKQLDTLKQDLENVTRRQPKPKATDPGHTARTSSDAWVFEAQTPSVKDLLRGLKFEQALPGDKRLAKVASIARSRSFREQQNKVLLEGRRLICDALAAGATPQTIFFSRVEKLRQLPLRELHHASLIKVKFEDIKIWSDLVAPQGIIAIFSKPDASSLTFPRALHHQSVPLSLICDHVWDAGVLGTLLRCAAAAGCERALLTKGCVDAWEPKVLRAAMGAHFRLPVFTGLDWDDIEERLPKLPTVHVADIGSMLTRDVRSEIPSTEVRTAQVCGKAHDVPACWEEYVESDSDDDEQPIPCPEPKVFHENWAQGNTALVVGGDVRGPSVEALWLAKETSGHKLFIPTAPGVDGLTSAMAASILLFEGRRQLLKLAHKASRRKTSVTR